MGWDSFAGALVCRSTPLSLRDISPAGSHPAPPPKGVFAPLSLRDTSPVGSHPLESRFFVFLFLYIPINFHSENLIVFGLVFDVKIAIKNIWYFYDILA